MKEIKAGKSAIQNIDSICFSKNGLLRDEFLRLYPSLFANAEKHFAIIRALAKKHQDLNRKQLIEYSSLTNGGGFTKELEELTQSGFISFFKYNVHSSNIWSFHYTLLQKETPAKIILTVFYQWQRVKIVRKSNFYLFY